MKKKLLILLSTLVVALLAFSLSACDLNLNKAAKITINITRTDKAKDCDIEVTSSYGELTQNGDTVSISINLLKNFAVTLSSNGFMTENVTVTSSDIKKGSATYNVTFGNTVPVKYETTIFEEYPNLTITSTLDTVSIEIKGQQALFNNPDKYSNPDITIAADGFESLILPYNELIALPTIKLVRPGYAQIIYAVHNYSTPNITLKDDRHRLYSPKIIGRNLYFEVPLYDGIYRSSFTSDIFTANKAYGTVIQYYSNYNDSPAVEISKEIYNYLNNFRSTSYQLDKDGNFISTLSVDSNSNNGIEKYTIYLNPDCESIIIFNNNNYSQYASVKKSEMTTFDYENLQYNNVTLYTTLYNSLNSQQLENFSINYVGDEYDSQYNTIQSIDGRIKLDNINSNGIFQYAYNNDNYEQKFYEQYINYNGDKRSIFIDGNLTIRNTVRPQINLQLEVYDGDRLLQGGNDILSGLAFSDGYYIKSNWGEYENLVNVAYPSQNYSYNLTAVYIDITKLEKVGEKTYRYKKPVYINSNNYYNVKFKINGESITGGNSSRPKADSTIFIGYNDQWHIETTEESITFYLTFNNTNYKITLNAIDFPADGTEFVYDLSLEN